MKKISLSLPNLPRMMTRSVWNFPMITQWNQNISLTVPSNLASRCSNQLIIFIIVVVIDIQWNNDQSRHESRQRGIFDPFVWDQVQFCHAILVGGQVSASIVLGKQSRQYFQCAKPRHISPANAPSQYPVSNSGDWLWFESSLFRRLGSSSRENGGHER